MYFYQNTLLVSFLSAVFSRIIYRDGLWSLCVLFLEANFKSIFFTYIKRIPVSRSSSHPSPLWPVLLGDLWISSFAVVGEWVDPQHCPGPACCLPLPVQPRQHYLWHSTPCGMMQRQRNFSSRQSHLRLYRSKNQHLRLLTEIIFKLVRSSSLFR